MMDPCLITNNDSIQWAVSLLHNTVEKWERSSLLPLWCCLLHRPPIWHRPYSTKTHPPQYDAQCHTINQYQMAYSTKFHICLNKYLNKCSTDMSYRSFDVHFYCHSSHCPCKMQTRSTIWQPVVQTSHHHRTLQWTVNVYGLIALSMSTQSVLILGLPSETNFLRLSPCLTATAAFLLHICLKITWPWTISPLSYIYIYIKNIWNFSEFSISKNRACKLSFIHPCSMSH